MKCAANSAGHTQVLKTLASNELSKEELALLQSSAMIGQVCCMPSSLDSLSKPICFASAGAAQTPSGLTRMQAGPLKMCLYPEKDLN